MPSISLADRLGPDLSRSACAYALAVLAAEQPGLSVDRPDSPLVVKVGGSLFDLHDLGPRLRHWLDSLHTNEVLIVPGGGPTANAVRDWDHRQALGEEQAHWLALRALTLNARFLAAVVPNAVVIHDLAACAGHWRKGAVTVLDPYPFMQADDGRPGSLPHTWKVTSDSLAARVAVIAGARRLILLKSVTLPEPVNWAGAAGQGFVDPLFANAAAGLNVHAINFRAWQP
jgi:aspartokinase-like uncharacterized kinase